MARSVNKRLKRKKNLQKDKEAMTIIFMAKGKNERE